MINIINGNLLDANEDILAHCCNCYGKMGAGVALAIKNKYKDVYASYKCVCRVNSPELLLGKTQVVKSRLNDEKYIANLFGQMHYGRGKQLNINALETSILHLISFCNNLGLKSIAMPYNIGCGLAGGDWDNEVYPLLHKLFNNNNINLTLYKL